MLKIQSKWNLVVRVAALGLTALLLSLSTGCVGSSCCGGKKAGQETHGAAHP